MANVIFLRMEWLLRMGNARTVKLGKNVERVSFSQINEVLDMPNLIEVQKKSYNWFLQEGLKEVFRDVASITDYSGNLVLDFVDYRMDEQPKYSVEECKERDATYAVPFLSLIHISLRCRRTRSSWRSAPRPTPF